MGICSVCETNLKNWAVYSKINECTFTLKWLVLFLSLLTFDTVNTSWWSWASLPHFSCASSWLMNSDTRVAHRLAAGLFSGCSFFCLCCYKCLFWGLTYVTFACPLNLLPFCLVWYVCVRNLCVLLLVGDFLSPPAMDPPVSKELSSSSSAIHSSERGERINET